MDKNKADQNGARRSEVSDSTRRLIGKRGKIISAELSRKSAGRGGWLKNSRRERLGEG